MSRQKRETGARKIESVRRTSETNQNAGMPRKPEPYGLTEGVDETQDKTRKSDGVDPPARRKRP
jgi:hypothetical protein